MKKILMLITLLTIGIFITFTNSIEAEEVKILKEQFPDQKLRTEICMILDKEETDTISTTEAEEIRSLMLNSTGIKNIEGLEVFKNLVMLDIGDNEIKEIPEKFETLQNLRILLINNNQITNLGKGITNLKGLEVLDASNNLIGKITTDIKKLDKLEQLQLQNNRITELPVEISSLESLEMLVLEGNRIGKLPKEIGKLSNLTILDLGKNLLEEIPWEIGSLKKLYFLDFSENRIHKMDVQLFNKLDGIKAVYLFSQKYQEKIKNSSIINQELKIRGLELYTLDLGFSVEQTILRPDGTETRLEEAIHGDFVIIEAGILDTPGEYILRTTISGGPDNYFGAEGAGSSIYEQTFMVNEIEELPVNENGIYLYGSIIVFCIGLLIVVGARFIKNRGEF